MFLEERADAKQIRMMCTPLMFAANNGHAAEVNLLLSQRDVNPDPREECKRTPLIWAAGNGHEAVVKLLLAQDSVKLDSEDEYGTTPYSVARENEHKAVARFTSCWMRLSSTTMNGQEAVVNVPFITIDTWDKYLAPIYRCLCEVMLF